MSHTYDDTHVTHQDLLMSQDSCVHESWYTHMVGICMTHGEMLMSHGACIHESWYTHMVQHVQPIADRVAQHLEIISKNFQFSTRRTRILMGFIIYYLVQIVNPMGRILVRWKSFRNNLEMLCHPICNWLYDTLGFADESGFMCAWVMAHTYGRYMYDTWGNADESWCMYTWVMAHTYGGHLYDTWGNADESWCMYTWVMAHTYIWRGACIHESWHTHIYDALGNADESWCMYTWVMAHTYNATYLTHGEMLMSHGACINESWTHTHARWTHTQTHIHTHTWHRWVCPREQPSAEYPHVTRHFPACYDW